MKQETIIREHLAQTLRMKGAHIEMEKILDRIPPEARGVVPEGFEHSVWQLLEHVRFCIDDIVDYMRNPEYKTPQWPAEYWEKKAAPSEEEWRATADGYRSGMAEMEKIVLDEKTALLEKIPHVEANHTPLREILIIIDHNAYHLGQIMSLLKFQGLRFGGP